MSHSKGTENLIGIMLLKAIENLKKMTSEGEGV